MNDQLEDQERLFRMAMNDDFNTALTLNQLFQYLTHLLPHLDPTPTIGSQLASRVLGFLQRVGTVLLGDLYGQEVARPPGFAADKLVELVLAERELLRRNKQFDRADAIRKELHDIGIEVTDTPTGPVWVPVRTEPLESANETSNGRKTSREPK
jgi:cysteinyl-tRNA synthetase